MNAASIVRDQNRYRLLVQSMWQPLPRAFERYGDGKRFRLSRRARAAREVRYYAIRDALLRVRVMWNVLQAPTELQAQFILRRAYPKALVPDWQSLILEEYRSLAPYLAAEGIVPRPWLTAIIA